MIHKENICEAAILLLKLLESYDDNHPEVVAKAQIAEVIIKKIAKISAMSYHEGVGILQESVLGFSEEWGEEKKMDDFGEIEEDEEE